MPLPEEIYLDNAATTRTDPDLAKQLARDMVRLYGNPSSAHQAGRAARAALDAARASLQAIWPGFRTVFTVSGSEAINLAMRGAWARPSRQGRRVLISAVEHPAVEGAAHDLARFEGAVVEEFPVERDGRTDLAALDDQLQRGEAPALVCCMHVQNEIGSLMPLREVGALVRRHAPAAFLLVDAVQGLGKHPVEPEAWCADAVAVASHKIHGPKGVGALLLAERHLAAGHELRALVQGGGQEHGLRSGTENVAAIVAFVEACRRALAHEAESGDATRSLRAQLLEMLRARVGPLVVNGPQDPAHASPAILSVSLRNVDSQALLRQLDEDGIRVSAGSACHSSCTGMSRTQQACGFEPWQGRGTLRFGIGRHTTTAEIDRVIERVAHHVEALRGSPSTL